ncbi:MAG TPA: hypothetical protein VMP01_29935 [Pirellulaceae bacterium]|nr:hypothetical protein [Pirellulaceae bacterium]
MNRALQATDARVRSQIDALVCGELSEPERGKLLTWLDADVARWRQCGLAFLEAQMWEEALEAEGSGFGVQGSEGGQGAEARGHEPDAGVQATSATRGKRWAASLVVAAASIAAFACGLLLQELRLGPQPNAQPIAESSRPAQEPLAMSGLLVASVPVNDGPLGSIAATLQIPVRPVDAASLPAVSSVPDHVRKQWERRGYELVEEQRYLPARLPDGRPVMVPVNEVKMKFVGKPVS